MHEAKKNGAVGIFFSGIIGSLTLNNAHFMPIYAEAEKLGLPICVHTGQSSRHLLDLFDLELNGTFATSCAAHLGFRAWSPARSREVSSKIRLLKFASWVPFLYHHLKRSARPRPVIPTRADVFASNNCPRLPLYVACAATKTSPYLAEFWRSIYDRLRHCHNDPLRNYCANMKSRKAWHQV